MNRKIENGGYTIRKPLYPGNHVYFVMNGLPHTGIISAIGTECYEVSNVTGMFMDWDSRCMSVDKKLCVGTQEIYIPEFPDKETASWIKSMGETMLRYENFPKKQIILYEAMSSIFTRMIEFIPKQMIFQLTNGKLYELYHHNDYGELLVGMDDFVIPMWIYHKQQCNVEKLVTDRLIQKLTLPKIATEYQVLKIYCEDSRYDGKYLEKYNDKNVRNSKHIQLLYKRESMKKRDITEEELVETLPNKFPPVHELKKMLLPIQW